MQRQHTIYVAAAIAAAALFGISAPIAKVLLGTIDPVPLAGLVYLGSGVVLLCFKAISRLIGAQQEDAPLTSHDVPWLIGAVLAGGVAAPIVLMLGIRLTPASTAALLLNFEGVATSLLAALLFREAIGRRIWLAIIVITLGSILLSWQPGSKWGISIGSIGVIAACILWGFDNNFTRNISGKDPVAIVAIKGICAGMISILIAIITGGKFPTIGYCLIAMIFGSLSYGLSIVLFIIALRGLGAARTSAYFGIAPFLGAIVGFIIFHNTPSITLLLGLPFMCAGAILLLGEAHTHQHLHSAIDHEHRHQHGDEHHRHSNESGWHSHRHIHVSLEHNHPHAPDDHHRHAHENRPQEDG